jgi:hypothetical protein
MNILHPLFSGADTIEKQEYKINPKKWKCQMVVQLELPIYPFPK